MAAPRKAWKDLAPGYKKRMQSRGLTARNWNTKKGAELRKAARGHAKTPERPSQAERRPADFPEYVTKRSDEMRQLLARKKALFGDKVKYNPDRARKSAEANPMYDDTPAGHTPATSIRPRTDYLRRFLRMSYDDVLEIDWTDDEWGFLFYH